jgi:addiction module HigA family antidote
MRVHEKIRAEIEKRGLSVTDAAPLLGLTRPSLSNVINGNASLSVHLALRLEDRFGMNARKLLMGQLDQDIKAARQESKDG